jgi:hypothetical protein
VVANFVDEDVGDDLAERFVGVFGPVVEDGAAIQVDGVGQLAGLGDRAVLRQTDAGEEAISS